MGIGRRSADPPERTSANAQAFARPNPTTGFPSSPGKPHSPTSSPKIKKRMRIKAKRQKSGEEESRTVFLQQERNKLSRFSSNEIRTFLPKALFEQVTLHSAAYTCTCPS